jgi:hypothetical protein
MSLSAMALDHVARLTLELQAGPDEALGLPENSLRINQKAR